MSDPEEIRKLETWVIDGDWLPEVKAEADLSPFERCRVYRELRRWFRDAPTQSLLRKLFRRSAAEATSASSSVTTSSRPARHGARPRLFDDVRDYQDSDDGDHRTEAPDTQCGQHPTH